MAYSHDVTIHGGKGSKYVNDIYYTPIGPCRSSFSIFQLLHVCCLQARKMLGQNVLYLRHALAHAIGSPSECPLGIKCNRGGKKEHNRRRNYT